MTKKFGFVFDGDPGLVSRFARTRIARSLSFAARTRAPKRPFRSFLFLRNCAFRFSSSALNSHKQKTSRKERFFVCGDPDENRTRVTAVKGRCLSRLTTGPYAPRYCERLVAEVGLEPTTLRVWTECSSQLSYSATRWFLKTLDYYSISICSCQQFL